MHFKWLELYKVKKAISLKETYVLEKLNSAELNNTIAGNRLKRFYLRLKKKKPEFIILASGYGKLQIKTNADFKS
jgi:hypothetical protein